MSQEEMVALAQQLQKGELPLNDFVERIRSMNSVAKLEHASLDLDRQRRCGYPEVVFAEGKSVATLKQIFDRLLKENVSIFATRVSAEKATQLLPNCPGLRYNEQARTLRLGVTQRARTGHVMVVTAGTSDLPVAEEARETLDWMGVSCEVIHDIGVAGPQRLLAHVPRLRKSDAIVVVAGMEGALPSVVGGHVACPVIAVPTSVGYGAAFGGLAALLGMLNSCASNVAVVNIDAGFKAGYVAGMIARGKHQNEEAP